MKNKTVDIFAFAIMALFFIVSVALSWYCAELGVEACCCCCILRGEFSRSFIILLDSIEALGALWFFLIIPYALSMGWCCARHYGYKQNIKLRMLIVALFVLFNILIIKNQEDIELIAPVSSSIISYLAYLLVVPIAAEVQSKTQNAEDKALALTFLVSVYLIIFLNACNDFLFVVFGPTRDPGC